MTKKNKGKNTKYIVAKESYIISIDFGTSSVKVVVARKSPGTGKLQVMSLLEVESEGIKRGVITNMNKATDTIIKAINETENVIGLPVENAVFGVNGSGISFTNSEGLVINTSDDNEIGAEDVDRLIEDAVTKAFGIKNDEVLHIIPKNYIIDNNEGVKNPVGMVGSKIESQVLIVSAETSFLRNFTKAVEQADITINDKVFTPLASSDFLLSSRQKKTGSILIDIGYNSTSYVVWDDEEIVSAGIAPMGSDHITSDLAVGLQTTIETADVVKKNHLNLSDNLEEELGEVEIFNPEVQDNQVFNLDDAKLYAYARVEEIFSYINQELKEVDKYSRLAGGCVLIGGGSKLKGIEDVAKKVLRIPVFKPNVESLDSEFVPDYNGDPTYFNAISLASYSLFNPNHEGLETKMSSPMNINLSGAKGIMKGFKKILPWG